jgi:hypothetical protein
MLREFTLCVGLKTEVYLFDRIRGVEARGNLQSLTHSVFCGVDLYGNGEKRFDWNLPERKEAIGKL